MTEISFWRSVYAIVNQEYRGIYEKNVSKYWL